MATFLNVGIQLGRTINQNLMQACSLRLHQFCRQAAKVQQRGYIVSSINSYSRFRPLVQKVTAVSARFSSSTANNSPQNEAEQILSLSMSQLHSRMTASVPLSCISIGSDGSVLSTKEEISKHDIASQFKLHARDIRDLDLKSEANPRILVRESTILLDLLNLRILVQADRALLLDSYNITESNPKSVFLYILEDRIRHHPNVKVFSKLPYELSVLEAALVSVTSTLEANLSLVKKEVEENLRELNIRTTIHQKKLDNLLDSSQKLAKLEQRTRLIREVIRDLLDSDEDMAAMYLSDKKVGKPHEDWDHQELEYLLETYDKAMNDIVESVTAQIGLIRKTDSAFRSSLDLQRNQIMILEAKVSIYTLAFATGTLVAGFYGMNLINYMEEAPMGFGGVISVSLVLSCLVSIWGSRKLRYILRLWR